MTRGSLAAPAAGPPRPPQAPTCCTVVISSVSAAADQRLLQGVVQNMERCFPAFQKLRQDPYLAVLRRLIRLGALEAVALLDDGGRITASCTLWHRHEYGTTEIQDVCVLPELRGRALCKRLLLASLAHLRYASRANVREARVYCATSNAAACKCYASAFGSPVHTTPTTTAFVKRVSGVNHKKIHSGHTKKRVRPGH